MVDTKHFETAIKDRLSELGFRLHDVDAELSHLKTKDLEDQAVDLEDDEVLEAIGKAAQQEVGLLNAALKRIKNGTYGTCLECGNSISTERLNAILYAPLCKECVRHPES